MSYCFRILSFPLWEHPFQIPESQLYVGHLRSDLQLSTDPPPHPSWWQGVQSLASGTGHISRFHSSAGLSIWLQATFLAFSFLFISGMWEFSFLAIKFNYASKNTLFGYTYLVFFCFYNWKNSTNYLYPPVIWTRIFPLVLADLELGHVVYSAFNKFL